MQQLADEQRGAQGAREQPGQRGVRRAAERVPREVADRCGVQVAQPQHRDVRVVVRRGPPGDHPQHRVGGRAAHQDAGGLGGGGVGHWKSSSTTSTGASSAARSRLSCSSRTSPPPPAPARAGQPVEQLRHLPAALPRAGEHPQPGVERPRGDLVQQPGLAAAGGPFEHERAARAAREQVDAAGQLGLPAAQGRRTAVGHRAPPAVAARRAGPGGGRRPAQRGRARAGSWRVVPLPGDHEVAGRQGLAGRPPPGVDLGGGERAPGVAVGGVLAGDQQPVERGSWSG